MLAAPLGNRETCPGPRVVAARKPAIAATVRRAVDGPIRETVPVSSRPSVTQWLRYALGGRLPDPMRDWVRHDLTDADWRWRQTGRVLLQAALPIVVILVLPVSFALQVGMAGLVLVGALSVAAAYSDELRDRRFRQHGLTPPERPDPPTWQGHSR